MEKIPIYTRESSYPLCTCLSLLHPFALLRHEETKLNSLFSVLSH